MDDYFFVSYSRADAQALGPQLADRLAAGTPSHRLWVDVRDLDYDADWDDQVEEAITRCRAVLLVMTPDSVRKHSGCKPEWVWALKCKKPLVPLRFDSAASLPFRLSSRQFIDFTQNLEQGLAKLRLFIAEMDQPKGHLRELRFQLADAERELARTLEPQQQARVEADIEDLRKQIDQLSGVAQDPAGAARATDRRITTGLEQVREPDRPKPETKARAKYINPPPITAPSYFQDRHAETELLADFVADPGVRMITVVGRGGVGKTALVCRLLKEIEGGRLPDDLGELGVDGIVYLRTPSAHPVNFANLFNDLCRLLPADSTQRLGQRYRDGHETPAVLMTALLAEIPPDQRVVVLLDNFEDLLDETGSMTEAALDEALSALLAAPAHGVAVLITTRVPPADLLLQEPGGQRRIDLDEGLPSPYAERILRARDPDGRLGLKSASDAVLGVLRERTRGYPRALEALAAILSADRDTTLTELVERTETLPDNVVEALIGQAFARLDFLTQHVVQALAIYPIPVPPVAVDYLLQPFHPAIDAAPVLTRLVNMQFVRRDAGRYYLHQVDRDYSLSQLDEGRPDDRDLDPAPFTQYALRHRAAEYFSQTQTPREEWKHLDDLAPQLAEFELRVQGGDYDTAAQVLFALDNTYLVTWAHYRLVLDLHARLSGRLTDPAFECASLATQGTCHLYMGHIELASDLYGQSLATAIAHRERAAEGWARNGLALCFSDDNRGGLAIEELGKALKIFEEIGGEEGQATVATNLANQYKAQGDLLKATEWHNKALDIDRRIGYTEGEAADLSNLGDCQALAGETDDAISSYQHALEIHDRVDYPYGKGCCLLGLAAAYVDQRRWDDAMPHIATASQIGESIGNAQVRADSLRMLAWAHLASGDLVAAAEAADGAIRVAYSPVMPEASLVQGVARLLQGERDEAQASFNEAVVHADRIMQNNPQAFDALDTKAIALLGLTLAGAGDHTPTAISTFRAARAIISAPGVVARALSELDALSPADSAGTLRAVRAAASSPPDATIADTPAS